MKKKLISLMIVIVILMALMPLVALASAGVTTDKTSALPSETISISGTVSADESVVIKITDEAGNIVFFDAAKADASGSYSADFVVPSNMAAGKLTVTVGSGSDVATTTITVKAAPQPTTPTSTPAPSSTATAVPSSSSAPSSAATAVPSSSSAPSSTTTAVPSSSSAPSSVVQPTAEPTGTDAKTVITPKEILLDEDTGIITIVIEVEELPEGTVAIETSDGEILYVSDAKDGLLTFQVTKDDVNTAGDIEIVALDEELSPLATLTIKVGDENEETDLIQAGESGFGGWMIIVYIAGALLILAALVWILLYLRNKHKQ